MAPGPCDMGGGIKKPLARHPHPSLPQPLPISLGLRGAGELGMQDGVRKFLVTPRSEPQFPHLQMTAQTAGWRVVLRDNVEAIRLQLLRRSTPAFPGPNTISPAFVFLLTPTAE